MSDKQHILVVDDDTRLRKLLKKYLTENGFDVSEASQAADAHQLLELFLFDLLVVDVMMPGQNGFEFTRQLRSENIDIPILMLTAMGDADNRIAGLEMGADDYLSKPFEPKELLLRMHNILKHRMAFDTMPVKFGNCIYQVQKGILTKEGIDVPLTTVDQIVLRLLCSKIGQAVPREILGDALGTDNLRTVDVQITRLRKKIETAGMPQCIQTVRGQGYALISV